REDRHSRRLGHELQLLHEAADATVIEPERGALARARLARPVCCHECRFRSRHSEMTRNRTIAACLDDDSATSGCLLTKGTLPRIRQISSIQTITFQPWDRPVKAL